MRDQISKLGGDVGMRKDSFETARAQLVDQRVARLRDSQRGIGLLERMDALDRLTSDRGPLWIREWFLRAVLVLVDSMPVLVKFLGGVTEYDRAVDVRIGRNRAVDKARVTREQAASVADVARWAEVEEAEADIEARGRLNVALAEEQQRIDDERERYLQKAWT